MNGLDFINGKEFSKEELLEIKGGTSVASQGGTVCGGGCNGSSGRGCGVSCTPNQQR